MKVEGIGGKETSVSLKRAARRGGGGRATEGDMVSLEILVLGELTLQVRVVAAGSRSL